MKTATAYDIWLSGFTRGKVRATDVLALVGLCAAYFVLRLVRLRSFPVFNDEGIYIEWAKSALADPNLRFISLTDGKQPLQTWLTIPFLRLLPGDSVLASRLVAVLSGCVTLVGIFVLVNTISSRRAAWYGAALYVFAPYFLFYDRLALVDSAVNASVVWIFCLSILLARTRRLDVALLLGIVGGTATLTKSSVIMFIGLLVTTPLLCTGSDARQLWKRRAHCLLLLGLCYAFIYLISRVQRLSPYAENIANKNYTFILTPAEFIANPFSCFRVNILRVPQLVAHEFGYLAAAFGILGAVKLYKKNRRIALYFALWIFVPFVVVLFITKDPYPRYLIFFASWVCVLAAVFIGSLSRRLKTLGVLVVFVSFAYADYAIILDPARLPFPKVDRTQYVEGWSSGWGIESVLEIARAEAKQKPVMLLAEGDFGMARDVLRASLRPSDTNISVEGRYPLDEAAITSALDMWLDKTVLVVFVHSSSFPSHWPLRLLARFDKPGGQSSMFVHRLTRDR